MIVFRLWMCSQSSWLSMILLISFAQRGNTQELHLPQDSLSSQMLIAACAAYREEILDDIVATMVDFNLLCDSLKSVSAYPEEYEKFRKVFFNEAMLLDEYTPKDMVSAATSKNIFLQNGHEKIVTQWVETHFWPLVQMITLRNYGIIEEQSPFRLKSIREWWEEMSFYRFRRNDVIVDIGAGTGTVSFILAKTGLFKTVCMTEVDQAMLFFIGGKLHSNPDQKESKLLLFEGASDHLGLPDTMKADIIFMREVFHHIKYKSEILAAVRQHLKPDGKLIIVESTIESEPDKKVRCPKAMHTKDLETWFASSGFLIEARKQTGEIMLYRLYAGS